MYWQGLKTEWVQWWRGLGTFWQLLPVSLVLLYWSVLYALGGLKADHIGPPIAQVVLFYLGPRFKPLFYFVLPLFLTGVLYDSQRYYADLIRGPVHVKEPYEFDKRAFGIETATGRLTPNEWFQLHTHPVLDFICGIAYIIFVPVFVLCAAYFRFFLSRKGTARLRGWEIDRLSSQVMWAFFWVNILGWSTYYWYAASPPWYVALRGFGPADLTEPANLAGCARFDALVGLPVFANWYGRSADVHGAIPSLHIAYPLQAVYYAFKFGALRVTTTVFFLLMCFSAVYLNHHYILDILWGSTYAITVCWTLDKLWSARLHKETTAALYPSWASFFPKGILDPQNQTPQ